MLAAVAIPLLLAMASDAQEMPEIGPAEALRIRARIQITEGGRQAPDEHGDHLWKATNLRELDTALRRMDARVVLEGKTILDYVVSAQYWTAKALPAFYGTDKDIETFYKTKKGPFAVLSWDETHVLGVILSPDATIVSPPLLLLRNRFRR